MDGGYIAAAVSGHKNISGHAVIGRIGAQNGTGIGVDKPDIGALARRGRTARLAVGILAGIVTAAEDQHRFRVAAAVDVAGQVTDQWFRPGLPDTRPSARTVRIVRRIIGETSLAPLERRAGRRADVEGVNGATATAHRRVNPDRTATLISADRAVEKVGFRLGRRRNRHIHPGEIDQRLIVPEALQATVGFRRNKPPSLDAVGIALISVDRMKHAIVRPVESVDAGRAAVIDHRRLRMYHRAVHRRAHLAGDGIGIFIVNILAAHPVDQQVAFRIVNCGQAGRSQARVARCRTGIGRAEFEQRGTTEMVASKEFAATVGGRGFPGCAHRIARRTGSQHTARGGHTAQLLCGPAFLDHIAVRRVRICRRRSRRREGGGLRAA